MLIDMALQPKQITSLAEWVDDSTSMAPVLMRIDDNGTTLHVGQGDDRATIDFDGNVTEEA